MKIKVSHPDRKPDFITGAYSDGVIWGSTVYVSGQACIDFKNSIFELGTIEQETHRTIGNITAILEAAGSSLDNIVKCTVHLADIKYFDRFNKVYLQYFTGIKPARTTVQSVLDENIKIEIDCIAMIG